MSKEPRSEFRTTGQDFLMESDFEHLGASGAKTWKRERPFSAVVQGIFSSTSIEFRRNFPRSRFFFAFRKMRSRTFIRARVSAFIAIFESLTIVRARDEVYLEIKQKFEAHSEPRIEHSSSDFRANSES